MIMLCLIKDLSLSPFKMYYEMVTVDKELSLTGETGPKYVKVHRFNQIFKTKLLSDE